jgi:hypothetical protein
MIARAFAALALACVASACMHIPLASVEEDAAAKSFETRPDLCGVYVFRPGSHGGGMELELLLDGHPFGRTDGGDYIFAWVHPGTHSLASRGDDDMRLNFSANAGTLVFVRQEGEMGYWAFASKLTLVGEDEGKSSVMRCERVATGF